MRQAGRSLPEYRAARGEGPILAAIADAALSAELTLQPVRRYGVDAAILFSDIVVPLHAIGFGVDVEPGRGPVVAQPFRSGADLDRLRPFEPDADAPYVAEAARLVRQGARRHRRCPDRLRRRAVHGGQLPRRRWPVAHLRPGEGADARRARPLGPADGAPGRDGGGVAAGPGRRPAPRRSSSSTAGPARSRPTSTPGSPCRPPAPCSRASRTSVCRPSSSASAPASCSAQMAGAGSDVVGVDWRVPLDEARRRVGAGTRRAGQSRPRAVPGAVAGRRGCRPRGAGGRRRRDRHRAMSSTSATACCPRPIRPSWPRSSSWCTRRPRGDDHRRPSWPTARRRAPTRSPPSTRGSAAAVRPSRAAGRARGPLPSHRRRVASGGAHPRPRSTRCAPRSSARAPGHYVVAFGAKHTDPLIEEAAAELAAAGRRAGGRARPDAACLVDGLAGVPRPGRRGARRDAVRADRGVVRRPALVELLAARVTGRARHGERVAAVSSSLRTPSPSGSASPVTPIPSSSPSPPGWSPRRRGSTTGRWPGRARAARPSRGSAPTSATWCAGWLPMASTDAVVVCPIGFVADHLEVLYDLDVEVAGVAAAVRPGLRAHRVAQRRPRLHRRPGRRLDRGRRRH